MSGASNTADSGDESSMMIVLMVVGVGTLLAGLLAIAYGILLELSLGNSLIVAGTVAACSGTILLGLCAVVTELKIIARQLADPRSTADAPIRAGLPQVAPSTVPAQGAVDDGHEFSQDQAAPSPAPPPWHEVAAARGQPDAAAEPVPAPPAPAAKPRRNLLFSSSLRKERERPAARVEPPVVAEPQPVPPVLPPVAEASEAPSPATFDNAWPKPERAPDRAPERAVERPRTSEAQRRSARNPNYATNGSAAPDRHAPPARAEEPPAVTVLKSGVVEGMAYSLYSDGSIEAQMPEGMMRFASIDELRAHLDHR
jgi:hypothetical protein